MRARNTWWCEREKAEAISEEGADLTKRMSDVEGLQEESRRGPTVRTCPARPGFSFPVDDSKSKK